MDKKIYEHNSKLTGEKIVEWKKCICGEEFAITDKDISFYDKVSPIFGGKKYSIPAPTLCPDCRQQRRLSFRNERKLYKRKFDLTGKDIISIYSPDKPYKVYDQKEWWSDKWNPLDYGRDFDFSKGFFKQFEELQKIVPFPTRSINVSENSDYCNEAGFLKDCYLTFSAGYNKNTFFSNGIVACDDCSDCLFVNNSKQCYECIDCKECFNVKYSQTCQNCSNSSYLYNCKNCNSCFMCANLNNKNYCISNKQYSKEEYKKIVDGSIVNLNCNLAKFKSDQILFIQRNIHKFANIQNCENCNGNNIIGSKNISYSFDITDSENLKYTYFAYKCYSSYDIFTHGDNSELMYEGMGVGTKAYNILFSLHSYDNISNIYYSDHCINNTSDCFGCVGLKNKQYCILNKQYTKEEYEKLVPQIIEHMKTTGEWGEFFPSSISPFGYNETVANEHYPLSKEEAISRGFKWSDYEAPFPKVDKTIPASKLPENIKDIPDDILNWAIECEVSKKPFRIIKQELEFYRKHNLPVPKRHPDVRHIDRLNKRAPRNLFLRHCDNCGIEMISVYGKNSEYKVYCEECYNKEIV